MNALRILETSLYTDDLEPAESVYAGVLGFELFAKEPGRHLFFKCGVCGMQEGGSLERIS